MTGARRIPQQMKRSYILLSSLEFKIEIIRDTNRVSRNKELIVRRVELAERYDVRNDARRPNERGIVGSFERVGREILSLRTVLP